MQLFQEPHKGLCNPQSLKRRQPLLFILMGVLLSSFKSIFLKKSPLVYILQDILLNDGQLTDEFYPNNILTISFFQNKACQFKSEVKTFLVATLFFCVCQKVNFCLSYMDLWRNICQKIGCCRKVCWESLHHQDL